MSPFTFIISMMLLIVSFGQAQISTGYLAEPTLPAYMYINCDDNLTPDPDALISTTAKMMDWCGCENLLNPAGANYYAGMSVFEDDIPKAPLSPARTWACSAGIDTRCDTVEDWYNALSNVSARCGNHSGYFYDASRQMAWGFDSYYNMKFCEGVAWVGISAAAKDEKPE
ncbi:hypothetical protein M406DRAFT_66994 [Cryphonectria parasitica EP155]|uniref:Uncharacterized protein n=1 Tax=Cryphonectria parasitica (strain ATCC 38755 / EP155) TaxID=660469 RepID=A0A9P4YCL2_CRYP1|nr:uncharacterized protein M406DRAFT_66994 [Cryphonectria parasitica EP155]KAF3770591.1 hypothetical protein M406DRAFT_66994 [Cryphonectria parasitica EP155]